MRQRVTQGKRIMNIEQGINACEGKAELQLAGTERVIEFAVRVLDAVECLPNSRVGNHVAAQLIRAGTSPAGLHPLE